MDFTKEQISEVLCKHAERENGLQDLMEIMIESMMVAENRPGRDFVPDGVTGTAAGIYDLRLL